MSNLSATPVEPEATTSRLGFMDLPPGMSMHLQDSCHKESELIASHGQSLTFILDRDPHRDISYLFTSHRRAYSSHDMKDEDYIIYPVRVRDDSCRNEYLGPSTLEFNTHQIDPKPHYTGWDKGWERWELAICLEILRTCRIIHREALPLLEAAYYSENFFQFLLEPDEEAIPRARELDRDCPKIFEYKDDDWQEHGGVPRLVRSSVFAASLNKAGKANATRITHLKITGRDCDVIAEQMPLITRFATLHMPGLRELEIDACEKKVHWDESPEYFHPNYTSSFWANGQFKPMYRALTECVGQITWLNRFRYDGQEHFGAFDWGPVSG